MKTNWKKLQNGSDIRGVAIDGVPGEKVNLTPDVALTLGKSFAVWLSKKCGNKADLKVAIGMDSRLSGPDLKQAVICGLSNLNVQVFDCDMASTPAMFMSTVVKEFAMDGAVMLTASHLPFNRNGMKFFTPEGGLEKKDISAILEIAENGVEEAQSAGSVKKIDFMSVYSNLLVDRIRKDVNDVENYLEPLKGLKIIVDAGNGAGGFFAEKVLKPLGADIEGSQFLDPDGTFPNHVPNPEDAEAMQSICDAVVKTKADLGIIFDTDVDRSAIVDGQGNPINRNELIALISAVILEEHPGSTIVTDSITSNGLQWFINSHLKGVHHRFKRGYKNVINESLRLNSEGQESWLAIETSGHAALKENFFLDDGAYLVAKLLVKMATMRKEGKLLTELISNLPKPFEGKEYRVKINTEDFVNYGQKVIEDIAEIAKSQDMWSVVPNNYEGIRVNCLDESEKGWFLVRLSLHDPVIPINIESDIDGGVDKIAEQLKSILTKYDLLDLSAF